MASCHSRESCPRPDRGTRIHLIRKGVDSRFHGNDSGSVSKRFCNVCNCLFKSHHVCAGFTQLPDCDVRFQCFICEHVYMHDHGILTIFKKDRPTRGALAVHSPRRRLAQRERLRCASDSITLGILVHFRHFRHFFRFFRVGV
jgi:hypothetical protein